jgi:hypothetical protein
LSARKTVRSAAKERSDAKSRDVEEMLLRRAWRVLDANPRDGLIFPKRVKRDAERLFYELMKKYSFRLFLRNAVSFEDGFELDKLLQYSTRECVEGYAEALLEAGIVERAGRSKFAFVVPPIRGFGPSLEWFVATMFEREFGCPALWGVKLADTKSGGDCDVIAEVENRFAYVEVKSSPPKHVTVNEVTAFLNRVEELRPNLALFLEDTELRMKDKIVVLFEEALKNRSGKDVPADLAPKRMERELFKVGDSIYIVNSKPELVLNVMACLKDSLSGKGLAC